jgi:hypothetical protein
MACGPTRAATGHAGAGYVRAGRRSPTATWETSAPVARATRAGRSIRSQCEVAAGSVEMRISSWRRRVVGVDDRAEGVAGPDVAGHLQAGLARERERLLQPRPGLGPGLRRLALGRHDELEPGRTAARARLQRGEQVLGRGGAVRDDEDRGLHRVLLAAVHRAYSRARGAQGVG